MFEERKHISVDALVASKRSTYVRPEHIDADPVQFRLTAEYDLACPEEYVLRSWEAMKALRVADRLGEIKVPTLMVVGGSDNLLTNNLHDYKLLPNASLHVFSRTAHYPNKEVPEDFAKVVLDFLRHGPSNPLLHLKSMMAARTRYQKEQQQPKQPSKL